MTAGIPGVGLGGIFYLLLSLFMPVVELVQTMRGRSSRERWRAVTRQALMALVILGMLIAVTWAVWVVGPWNRTQTAHPGWWRTWLGFIVLAIVLIGPALFGRLLRSAAPGDPLAVLDHNRWREDHLDGVEVSAIRAARGSASVAVPGASTAI